MHGSAGLHSALAVKRQRRLREQAAKRRAAERRMSCRTDSMDSMDHHPTRRFSSKTPSPPLASSIGMLHLGVCFTALGFFLIGSGLLPDDVMTWRSSGWWNEMVITGIFVTAVGLFLVVLNCVVSRREEVELHDYVAKQLTRSKSGHRLERDVETGGLTTKHHRKFLEKERESKQADIRDLTPTHSPLTKIPPPNAINGEIVLEKILEEEILDRDLVDMRHLELRETISNTTTASLSPETPSETRELIVNGRQYSFNSRQY
ncbi:hypothetical protein NQ317_005614 [Molorchus minor]|uniref:Uncharacterized protein n=1 Tax=Molorchus minor TaxID=1323400 RepID=A0ABQ9K7W5_9CUCU|nr:hypothetical protein NQ317_005614 [Molorchus minor]